MPPAKMSFRRPVYDAIQKCYEAYGVRADFVGPNNIVVPWTPVTVAIDVYAYLERVRDNVHEDSLLNPSPVPAPASITHFRNLVAGAAKAWKSYENAPATITKKMPAPAPLFTFYTGKVLTGQASYDFWYYADGAMIQIDAADGVQTKSSILWQAVKDSVTGLTKYVPGLPQLPSFDLGILKTLTYVMLGLWGLSILKKGK